MTQINLVATVLLIFALWIAPTAAFADLDVQLNGLELIPGVTTKDCAAHTYVTTGIRFAGVAEHGGAWTAKVNAQGVLDDSCEPIECTSPVQVTSGTLILATSSGILVTDVSGSLDFRPGPRGSGLCPTSTLTGQVDPIFQSGVFTHVTGGSVMAELDHNFLIPRVDATLALTE
ncbi:MAG TPA: hypothetical protein VGT40_01090 [Methylomirabilota bacterium]|jgi:hypothetical protein|nr:hypothetical protein [Methylomirabilota bacterium]